jgi:Na+/H+ antiporter NhaD/arsenite permease-like protein
VTTAAVLFALTYLVIGMQRLPRLHIGRPAGALLGAVGMVAFGVIDFDTARRDGVEVGFSEYLKVGAPLTLLTCLIAWAWLALASGP